MNNQAKIIVGSAVAVLIIVLAIFFLDNIESGADNNVKNLGPGQYDNFAKCLAEKEITMYGADWCAHCQNEKKGFGNSFQYVPYVECPKNPKVCLDKGVEGYPTWIWPDGKKLVGEQGLEKLSKESGCQI